MHNNYPMRYSDKALLASECFLHQHGFMKQGTDGVKYGKLGGDDKDTQKRWLDVCGGPRVPLKADALFLPFQIPFFIIEEDGNEVNG